jgi:hypothetical protein
VQRVEMARPRLRHLRVRRLLLVPIHILVSPAQQRVLEPGVELRRPLWRRRSGRAHLPQVVHGAPGPEDEYAVLPQRRQRSTEVVVVRVVAVRLHGELAHRMLASGYMNISGARGRARGCGTPSRGRTRLEKNCISDVKYGIYILSHILILDQFSNQSFLKFTYLIIRKLTQF